MEAFQPYSIAKRICFHFSKWRLILTNTYGLEIWLGQFLVLCLVFAAGFVGGFFFSLHGAWCLNIILQIAVNSRGWEEKKKKKQPKQVVWKKWIFKCLIQLETLKVYIDRDDNSPYASISWHKHFVEMNVEFLGPSANPPCWLNLFKELFCSPLNLNDFSRCTKGNNVKILLLQQKWFQLAGNWFCKSLVTAVFRFMWWLKK